MYNWTEIERGTVRYVKAKRVRVFNGVLLYSYVIDCSGGMTLDGDYHSAYEVLT